MTTGEKDQELLPPRDPEGPGLIPTDPPPPDVEPSVTIHPLSPRAGVPTTLVVTADPGIHYALKFNKYVQEPKVKWKDIGTVVMNRALHVLNSNEARIPVTFPKAGNSFITAWGETTTGTIVSAANYTAVVASDAPPEFSITEPAAGSTIDLGPAGASITVRVTPMNGTFYPWAVRVDHDGVSTTETYNGGSPYAKGITLNATPSGNRTISVKCTDKDGFTQTKTVVVGTRDNAPPTVTLDAFPADIAITTVPFTLALTGRTPGAASGITAMTYSVNNGPSFGVVNTAAAGDFSTWRADISLPTTGTFGFTVTATNTRGTQRTASGSVLLHF